MKQFFNTLLYGDSKTKGILWTMTILSFLALALTIFAALSEQFVFFVMALILVVAVVVVAQQYNFSDLQQEELEITEEVSPEDILVRYTERRVKQIFIKFRVKPDHRPIIIDRCRKHKIVETPAYVWVFRGRVHFLLLEKNARELVFPASDFRKITYQRGVPINMKGEYRQFRKPSLLTNVFASYLPSTYDVGRQGIKKQCKNLYVVGEEIAVTNNSVRQFFDLLGANFELHDKLTDSGDYSEDFIEMYKAYTLFRDMVWDANQYKEKVLEILTQMAVSNMLEPELRLNLEKMQKFRFITEEYAGFCLEKRAKAIKERSGKK